ncbi:hypothetical protein BHY08_07810 [Vagococcus teuberi]|uniref:Acetyltransferase n=2 Tax=Enterococcaceae TaxID=81852 RepID=A0A1J0A8K5_9ENTE|nr:hypothetical protein BHY08_07810 [Vagococcus teuberi]
MLRLNKSIKLMVFQFKWRKQNKDNFTEAINYFNPNKVSVGKGTYGKLKVIMYNNPDENLVIGSFCSISDNVEFLLGGEHHPYLLFNYPFLINYIKNDTNFIDNTSKGAILVGDDVWIGRNVLITSGVKIGNGAIIAAGSTITKDIPAYSIATTNRIIKYRFSNEICNILENFNYSSISEKWISDNIQYLYEKDISIDLIESLMRGVDKNN